MSVDEIADEIAGQRLILTAFVRAQLDTFDEPGPPDVLAERIAWLIPERQLRHALAQALPSVVREAIHRERSALRNPGVPGKSRKQQAYSWYSRILRAPECLAPGVWKRLGELTPAEVDQVAAMHRRKGEETLAVGARYALLAKTMRNQAATLVADLPEPVLREVLQ